MTIPDPTEILAKLDVAHVSAIESVSGGSDTSIWKVTHGDQISALRLFRTEQADSARRESIAMLAAQRIVPVPQLRKLGVWQDRPALLLEWMPGVPLLDLLISEPERADEFGIALGRTQALIHTVQAPVELQSSGWAEWIGIPYPAESRGFALLHFDYHPLNVLFDSDRVSAVVDWPNCGAGDPRLDAARTLTMLRLAPIRGVGIDPEQLVQVRNTLIHGWRKGYLEISGSLVDFEPFLTWAKRATQLDWERKNNPDFP